MEEDHIREIYELNLYDTEWSVWNETRVFASMPPNPQICEAYMCGNDQADADEDFAVGDGAEGYGWNKAHARLIAAAPDLYAALRELFLVSAKVSPTAKETVKALNKAHDALKKAGGMEPIDEEERQN